MPLLVPYVAFDPGSRRLGAVAALGTDAGMHVLAAEPIAVDEHDLGAAVEHARAFVLAHGARGIVIEKPGFYLPRPPRATGDVAADNRAMAAYRAKAIAMEHHVGVARRLADALAGMGDALGIRVRGRAGECNHAAWTHRIVPGRQGGIRDGDVNAALARRIVHGFALLRTQDLRDAAGAWLWSMIDPPPLTKRGAGGTVRLAWWAKGGVPLPPSMRTLAAKLAHWAALRHYEGLRWRARRAERAGKARAVDYLARAALPCACGPGGRPRGKGRHAAWCAQGVALVDPLDVLLGLA